MSRFTAAASSSKLRDHDGLVERELVGGIDRGSAGARGQRGVDLAAGDPGAAGDRGCTQTEVSQGGERADPLASGQSGAVFVVGPLLDDPLGGIDVLRGPGDQDGDRRLVCGDCGEGVLVPHPDP